MIRYALFMAGTVPVTVFFSLVAVAGGLLRAPGGLFDWVHRSWSRILLRMADVRVRVEGLENLRPGRPQVLVCNHQSMFDILALFAALPVSLRFVAKIELSRLPIFATAMRQAGHVFIDRSDRSQAIETMRRAGRRMKEEGLSLGLFPEGTRSPDGSLRPFKKGPFVLAIDTGATLVPVAVSGGAAVLPKGSRRLEARPIRIRCGEPIDLEAMTREDRDWLLEKVRGTIAEMLDDIREPPAAA